MARVAVSSAMAAKGIQTKRTDGAELKCRNSGRCFDPLLLPMDDGQMIHPCSAGHESAKS
jgi:hypothetical protein